MLDFFDSLFLADDESEAYRFYGDEVYFPDSFDDESEFYNPYEGMGRATDRDIERFEDPAGFPTYDPAQSLTDYTFFEYDDQGRIDVAATEDNQAEFQKLYENYRDGDIGYNTYSRQISELQQKAGSPVSFINIGDQDSKALLNAAKFLSNVGGDSANKRMKAAGYPRSGRASGIPSVGAAGTQSLADIAMEGMRSTGGKFGVDVLKNQVFVQPTISMSESPGSKRGSVTPTKTEVASARKTRGFNRYIQGLA